MYKQLYDILMRTRMINMWYDYDIVLLYKELIGERIWLYGGNFKNLFIQDLFYNIVLIFLKRLHKPDFILSFVL